MVKQDRTHAGKDTQQQASIRKGGGLLKHVLEANRPATPDYLILENVSKSSLQRLEVSKLPKNKPDFDLPGASKDALIAEWLKAWIRAGVAKGDLNDAHLLPRKADIANYLNVSVGTVQNAIRYIEDEGFVESKQRIGTMIRNPERETGRIRKLTSKRDQAVIAVKQLILDKGFLPGQALPSAREVAKQIGSAPNTTRLALEHLAALGIVDSLGTRGNKANWYLNQTPTLTEFETVSAIESDTLIDQVERDLKQLIADNYDIGAKLPSHLDLAATLKVSIKTVHDAMCRVIEQGIVQSKRGRYGTYVLRKPDTDKLFSTTEAASIFMPAQEALFYNYEKVEKHLKGLIAQQHQVGDKLPSMVELAQKLDVSSNTIRKALIKLADDNIVRFERGRYGGTFVSQIPDVKGDAPFAWVSINPETVQTYRKSGPKGSAQA